MAGNIITDAEGRQFTFNGDNKQIEVKDASNNVVGTYYYDGDGKRIKKVTNTENTTFVYSGGKLVAEYSTQTPPVSPVTQYLMTDMLGSPRVITDQNGNVTSRRDFMPFGEDLYGIGGRDESVGYTADSIRQKFTGYQKDDETGLDFAEARYYNNQNGRFTAVDPLLASGKSANPQTFNRYAYVMNNPIAFTDPSGMQAGSPPKVGDRDQFGHTWDGESWYDPIPLLIRAYAYFTGGEDNFSSRTFTSNRTPVTRSFDNFVNPTSMPTIEEFNRSMERVDAGAQYVPVFSSLYNAQKAAMEADTGSGSGANAIFQTSLFGADLATTVFTGGGTTRKIIQGGAENIAERGGFNLALGLERHLDDFAMKTNSQTYAQRANSGLFIPEKFWKFADEAKQINFNLRDFSFSNYADWLKNGNGSFYRNTTNWELNQIMTRREYLKKTNFYVAPPLK